MSKLAWVLLPLLLATLWLVVLAWRGRLPPRLSMNVGFSLLLLIYVGSTAGLGIFWVANQQLPVFDWHYLFGYATVLLLLVHLAFNVRVVWRHVFKPKQAAVPAMPATDRGRLMLLGGLGALGATGGAFLLGLRHGRTELHIDAPSAAASGAGGAVADVPLAVVERFHEFSAHSRRGVFRRAPSVEWGDPPLPFKAYPGRPLFKLPPPARAGRGDAPLDVAALSTLLWHTAGVNLQRGPISFRTSPSSGALFATELYVVARKLPGLEPGLWHYDGQGHALQRLSDAPPAAQAIGSDRNAPAHVLATAIFRRSGHKYRDRTYRYVLADLGHALENLRASAAALGVPIDFVRAFDEARAAAALKLDEAEEGVLALLALGDEPAAPQPAGADRAGAGLRWQPTSLTTGGRLGVTDAIHRATSLREAALPATPHAPMQAALEPSGAGLAIRLPPPQPHRMPMLEAIARRRSVRRYSGSPLQQPLLSALLDAMARRHRPLLSPAVRIHVVTQAVDGLPPAAWRYDALAHVLQPRVQAPDLRSLSRRAALDQDVVGDAGAVFVLAIDRASFAADAGGAARGYRHAFLEAGLVGERLYLEGVALGLGVCGVGAFYDDEAAALAGVDPAREWVVHFAAVGVPA